MTLLGEANNSGEQSNSENYNAEGKDVDNLNTDFQSASAANPEQEHLQDKVVKTEESDANSDLWFYDDDKPAEGARPEWLKPKYKTVTAQAKAYNDAEKKLGKFQGAPETYDTAIPDMPEFKFEEGDPMLSEFLEIAKESNASQEFVTKALAQYVKSQNFWQPDPQAEMEKIGLNAKAEIAQVNEWAGQRLSPDEYNVFKDMITTAETFKVVQKLRRVTTSQNETAVSPNMASSPKITEQKLLEMIADPKFNTDPLYRKEVEAKAQQVWG